MFISESQPRKAAILAFGATRPTRNGLRFRRISCFMEGVTIDREVNSPGTLGGLCPLDYHSLNDTLGDRAADTLPADVGVADCRPPGPLH